MGVGGTWIFSSGVRFIAFVFKLPLKLLGFSPLDWPSRGTLSFCPLKQGSKAFTVHFRVFTANSYQEFGTDNKSYHFWEIAHILKLSKFLMAVACSQWLLVLFWVGSWVSGSRAIPLLSSTKKVSPPSSRPAFAIGRGPLRGHCLFRGSLG